MESDSRNPRSGMPVCRKCAHFYITHDPQKPYGCRAMGFKSRNNPALVVFESSGMQCRLFTLKKHSSPGDGGTA